MATYTLLILELDKCPVDEWPTTPYVPDGNLDPDSEAGLNAIIAQKLTQSLHGIAKIIVQLGKNSKLRL